LHCPTDAHEAIGEGPQLGSHGCEKIPASASEAEPPNISDVREKFGTLSEAIDVYMTGLHLTPPQGVKVAVCPLVNKPWLQEGPALANPYYGKEMSTCGSFR